MASMTEEIAKLSTRVNGIENVLSDENAVISRVVKLYATLGMRVVAVNIYKHQYPICSEELYCSEELFI